MDDNDLENIDDFGDIDEFMYWVTITVLFLMTVVFLAGIAGLIWALI
jgi:hypothetical protein